jgi:hypothetical protein
MYKSNLWEEDKGSVVKNYGSSSYDSGEGGAKDIKYHESDSAKYGSGDVSSDYRKNEESDEKRDEEKKDIFGEEEEENKKEDKITDEEIPFRAAKQVFAEAKMHEMIKEKKTRKKDKNSIEDAIKKAIDQEKKVIIMDN